MAARPTDAYDLLRVHTGNETVTPQMNVQQTNNRIDELERKLDEQAESIEQLIDMNRTTVEANQLIAKRNASANLYKKESDKHFWASSGITFLLGAQFGVLLVSLLSALRK